MTRYAASCVTYAGHKCQIHDIAARSELPSLCSVDILGVACPTMYFRPSFAMERFVAQLTPSNTLRPSFLLATAGGEPGAHFPLLAEQLSKKGFVTLGAHWVIFPESWPPHLAFVKGLAKGASYLALLTKRYPILRPWLGIFWPALGVPYARDRDKLKVFIEEMILKATNFDTSKAPSFEDLHKPLPGTNWLGNMVDYVIAQELTAVEIIPEYCTKCGICIKICPVGCIRQQDENAFPSFGLSCTGCWACYQHCPEQAITGWGVKRGGGHYPGPSPELKHLFKPNLNLFEI